MLKFWYGLSGTVPELHVDLSVLRVAQNAPVKTISYATVYIAGKDTVEVK